LKTSKPIIVLTNFWDANALIDYGFLLHRIEGDDTVYKVNLVQNNFSVYSIALSNPPLAKLPHLGYMARLDFFCPTYDMLCRYKSDKDWRSYTKDYHKLLRNRKENLKDWMDTLVPNHVYFLCCWENTIGGAKCHRQLLYSKLLSSEIAMEKLLPIYRHGEKIYKEERNGEIEISMPTGQSARNVFTVNPTETFTGSDSESYVVIVDSAGREVTRVNTNPDIGGVS
jgi:hypothetical protein